VRILITVDSRDIKDNEEITMVTEQITDDNNKFKAASHRIQCRDKESRL
jgi:hypothetical protein